LCDRCADSATSALRDDGSPHKALTSCTGKRPTQPALRHRGWVAVRRIRSHRRSSYRGHGDCSAQTACRGRFNPVASRCGPRTVAGLHPRAGACWQTPTAFSSRTHTAPRRFDGRADGGRSRAIDGSRCGPALTIFKGSRECASLGGVDLGHGAAIVGALIGVERRARAGAPNPPPRGTREVDPDGHRGPGGRYEGVASG
jgi:hypothetical protein